MKTTAEIAEIVRLKDDRAIRHAFNGSIHKENGTYYIRDEALVKKFGFIPDKKFLTLEEAAEYLQLKTHKVLSESREGNIAYFKLQEKRSQGSQCLYRKEDLDKYLLSIDFLYVNSAKIRNTIRGNILRVISHFLHSFEILSERQREILISIATKNMTLEDLAKRMNLSRERVRQIKDQTLVRLYRVPRQIQSLMEDYKKMKRENELLRLQIERLKHSGDSSIPEGPDALAYTKILQDIDILYLSVRAYNGLKAAKIGTIKELLEIPIEVMLKYRNVGKKSIPEINEVVFEYCGIGLNRSLQKRPVTLENILELMEAERKHREEIKVQEGI